MEPTSKGLFIAKGALKERERVLKLLREEVFVEAPTSAEKAIRDRIYDLITYQRMPQRGSKKE